MTMEIEWKLFADLAECAETRTTTITLAAESTVQDALSSLLSEYPSLAEQALEEQSLRTDINVLRNGSDVRSTAEGLDTPLSDGDELALFPPVSGG